MNRNSFFFLIFTIFIATIFTWLNSTWLSYKGFSFTQKEKKVDYYLSDFTLLNTYPDGSMRYHIKGQYLIHQQSSGASEIFKPIIQARDFDENIINLTANNAIQRNKNGLIELKESVKLIKTGIDTEHDFTIETKNILYSPTNREISSDEELEFSSKLGKFNGTGFNTKLDQQEIRIHNNVQAVFTPAK